MPRTINANQAKRIQALENTIQGTIMGRSSLMSRMGLQYGGDRNIYQALGYPEGIISFQEYFGKYSRQDIAKAIINRPVDATWRGKVAIEEKDDEKLTGLELAWKEIYESLNLKSAFIRLDKLASLGKYGVLMLGFDDAKTVEALAQPVNVSNKRKLLYVKPLSEVSAKIGQWEEIPSNARYGLPVLYDITTTGPGGSMSSQLRVHYSRIIHVPGELLESECEGVPILEAVYNRLMDLEKLVGGSGEMFWRGARPGFKGKVAEGFQFTDASKLALQTQVDEYEHNLRRFFINEGVDLDTLEMQVASPKDHVNVQMQMISAVTGIPLRILFGSERGELASSEDRATWLETIQGRREDYAEVQIVRPLIERCVKFGAMPKYKDSYRVKWTDIFAPSQREQADIGKTRASALQSYMNNPAAANVIPPRIFFELMLGLDKVGVEHVMKLYEEAMGKSVDEEMAAIAAAADVAATPVVKPGKPVVATPPVPTEPTKPAVKPTVHEEDIVK